MGHRTPISIPIEQASPDVVACDERQQPQRDLRADSAGNKGPRKVYSFFLVRETIRKFTAFGKMAGPSKLRKIRK